MVLRFRRDACPKCGGRMKWEPYINVHRPDVLSQHDQRAPINWAWHCRCGMWIYGRPGPPHEGGPDLAG